MSELGITEEEWKNEIDALPSVNKKRFLTQDEIEKIDYARDRREPKSWRKLHKWFRQRGIIIDREVMKREYELWLKDKENYFEEGIKNV